MKQEFPKKYDLQLEQEIYALWEKEQAFLPASERPQADSKTAKGTKKSTKQNPADTFMMTLPPPNVTGVLHVGHGLMLAIEDAIIRYNRMQGKDTLWLPATDHAGIATQVKVEDKLRAEGKDRESLGRDVFLRHVWDWATKSRNTIIGQTKRMGASLDRSREEFTLSEKLSRAVRKSFSNLHNQGKVYEGTRIVNRSVGTQSVISDLEVVYKEEEGTLYYLKYFLEGKGEAITIATTRPETIFADAAIAVSPHDKRYKKMVGKKVLIPIINKAIPIIADAAVDMTFGTGALKVTPTHDPVDFEIGQRNNLPLDVYAIDKKWLFTQQAGPNYAGRHIDQAYEGFMQELEEIGNIEKTEKHIHKVPFCERSGTRIQPLLSRQWFIDVAEPAQKTIDALDSGDVQVHPERFNDQFKHWLGNIQPWCISRQLWRGHRIPVWKSLSGKYFVFDEDAIIAYTQANKKDKKNTILSMILFNVIADSRLPKTFSLEALIDILTMESIVDRVGRVIDAYLSVYRVKFADDKILLAEVEQLSEMFASSDASFEKFIDVLENTYLVDTDRDEYTYSFDTLAGNNETNLTQEEDVLDTWFSSALWPFSTLGWPDKTADMDRYYPNDLLETWYDILFFWVARMMMMGEANTQKMPFKNVYFHGLVRDEKWRKMSKSLGNIVDPISVIEKFGADALRCSLIIGSTPGNDVNYSESKTEYYFRFANKLWNASRFISMKVFGENEDELNIDLEALSDDITTHMDKLNHFDQWMLQRLSQVIVDSERAFTQFQLGDYGHQVVQLVYGDFCDWYIEIAKREKSEYTDKVLLYVLGTQLKLLHPFMPFVTEKLRNLLHFDGLLATSTWPLPMTNIPKDYKIAILMDMITGWRNLRSAQQVKPHEKAHIAIQSNVSFNNFVKDYEDLVKDLVWAESVEYHREDQDIPEDYVTQLVVDMKIGLKAHREINKKDILAQSEKQLIEEENFMQSLRTMLGNSSFASQASSNIIEEKQKKLNEVKQKIASLKLDIAKLKMELS